MGAFMRSLKYASFRAGRVIGITAGMSVGFVFYFTFLNGESFTVENLISRFPLMLIFIANLMFLIYGMVDVASYAPVAISGWMYFCLSPVTLCSGAIYNRRDCPRYVMGITCKERCGDWLRRCWWWACRWFWAALSCCSRICMRCC